MSPKPPERKRGKIVRWRRRKDGRLQRYYYASVSTANAAAKRNPASVPTQAEIRARRRSAKTTPAEAATRRPGKAARRPGKAASRPGKAVRRPGKAARRPGKAASAEARDPAAPEPGRVGAASGRSRAGVPASPGPRLRRRAVTEREALSFRPLRAARYTTWFKAYGTLGNGGDMMSAPHVNERDAYDEWVRFSGIEEAHPDFPAPFAWFSNQSELLGQVKFDGLVKLDALIERLNKKLQFVGEGVRGFDFREAYDAWEFHYFVLEDLNGTESVPVDIRRSG